MSINARQALQKAFVESVEEFPTLKDNHDVRRMMAMVLQTLCNPEHAACESWEDVEQLVREVVDMFTPETLQGAVAHLHTFFQGVVKAAREKNAVFISPPPYQ